MPILEWVVPGRAKKSTLRSRIAELAEAARRESVTQGLSARRSALWETQCGEAAELVYQLLIKNSHKQLDWGLKGHRGRVNHPRLVTIYWWMLLYQLVMLRNRGLEGYCADEEFRELSRMADRFMRQRSVSPEFNGEMPEPWDKGWRDQVTLEAGLGIYNRTMELLGLYIDPGRRIEMVSLFTSATERAYDSRVRRNIP